MMFVEISQKKKQIKTDKNLHKPIKNYKKPTKIERTGKSKFIKKKYIKL